MVLEASSVRMKLFLFFVLCALGARRRASRPREMRRRPEGSPAKKGARDEPGNERQASEPSVAGERGRKRRAMEEERKWSRRFARWLLLFSFLDLHLLSLSLSHTFLSIFFFFFLLPAKRSRSVVCLSLQALCRISFIHSADSELQTCPASREKERQRASRTKHLFFSSLNSSLSPHFALSEVGSPGPFSGRERLFPGSKGPELALTRARARYARRSSLGGPVEGASPAALSPLLAP